MVWCISVAALLVSLALDICTVLLFGLVLFHCISVAALLVSLALDICTALLFGLALLH